MIIEIKRIISIAILISITACSLFDPEYKESHISPTKLVIEDTLYSDNEYEYLMRGYNPFELKIDSSSFYFKMERELYSSVKKERSVLLSICLKQNTNFKLNHIYNLKDTVFNRWDTEEFGHGYVIFNRNEKQYVSINGYMTFTSLINDNAYLHKNVSGTFEFTAVHLNSMDTIRVTNGSFHHLLIN